jgi:hypothetical protein
MRPHVVAGLLVGLVLTACLAQPFPSSPPPLAGSPSPPARPSPATPPPPALTPFPATAMPEPSIPPDLSRTAVVDQDGVRITIELERNPMPAGEVTWVTKTIANMGEDPIQYFPCGEAMSVIGQLRDRPWRSGGRLPNPEAEWKKYLLQQLDVRDGRRQVVFLPAGLTGSSSGCGDIAYVEILAPGKALRERSRWDGLTFRRLAPPPTSIFDLVGSFAYAHAARVDVEAPKLEIDVHLEAWIDGRRDAYLDPGEVADVALRDARLTAILAARDLHNGNEGVLIFDPVSATYQVGMLESGNLPVSRAHLLTIDAVTGEIEGWVERDWDYAVDDFP